MIILQKMGNLSELPELICLAISTGSANETRNAENHKMKRFTNIFKNFYSIFMKYFQTTFA